MTGFSPSTWMLNWSINLSPCDTMHYRLTWTVNMAAKTVLNTRTLIAALTSQPVSSTQLSSQLKVSRATLLRYMAVLLEAGLVVQEGQASASTYRLRTLEEMQAASAPPPGNKVHLEMSEATAGRVFTALEFYARLGIGQFGPLLDLARMGTLKRTSGEEVSYEQLDEAEEHLNRFKQSLLGMASNASFGIFSPHVSPDVKEVWAVSKSIRHRLAWDRTPAGGMGTSHDEPMSYEDVPGLEVHSAPSKPSLVDLSQVPAGMLMQVTGGKYRIIGPSSDGEAFQLVSESRSWQTAILKAKNKAAGHAPRDLGF